MKLSTRASMINEDVKLHRSRQHNRFITVSSGAALASLVQ